MASDDYYRVSVHDSTETPPPRGRALLPRFTADRRVSLVHFPLIWYTSPHTCYKSGPRPPLDIFRDARRRPGNPAPCVRLPLALGLVLGTPGAPLVVSATLATAGGPPFTPPSAGGLLAVFGTGVEMEGVSCTRPDDLDWGG